MVSSKRLKGVHEAQEDKIFAVISYLFILCIVPLVLKKDNQFVLFHAKQGLVIFIAEVAVFIFSVVPVLGALVLQVGIFVLGIVSLFGIIQSLMGKSAKIPIVSDIADKIVL